MTDIVKDIFKGYRILIEEVKANYFYNYRFFLWALIFEINEKWTIDLAVPAVPSWVT